ncbi:MAG: hypothetical protein QM719_12430 [Thermomonas sp.]
MQLLNDLIDGANLRGGEYAWPLDIFPEVLQKAKSLELGCLGGQFQFRTQDSTCEMYWLNADPSGKTHEESWHQYVTRSCAEVLSAFSSLMSSTDFHVEASRWSEIPELSGRNASPEEYLCFVAYFVNEAELMKLREKATALRR